MKKTLLRWGWRLGAAALLLWGAGEVALRLTPFPAEVASPPAASTEFLDRNGVPLRLMLVEERHYARPCTLAELSPWIVPATLSAEDKRFWSHSGVDGQAIARALTGRWRGGAPEQGGSTITQQLVKLSRPGARTLGRKLAEAWLALRVERSWSKEQILTAYLNRLEYGNLQVGVQAASRFYFGKAPAQLSAAEAAFLASLPRAPSRLNPHRALAEAQARERWVLGRMERNGVLPKDVAARAPVEPLKLVPPKLAFAAPHFVDLLLQRRGLLPEEGGPVMTTVDLALNRVAEQALANNLRQLKEKNAGSGAVVVIHNPTGEVLALTGAGDYFQAGVGQINGAWMVRSPGSAVKPFTYLLALEQGANPSTVVADVPTSFATPDGVYRPNNYNHRFYGPVSLRFALGNSLNVGAIRALEMAGGPTVLQHALQQAGITTLGHGPEYYGLGLTLGNGEVRLLELASAYATLARLGEALPYRMVRPGAAVQATPQRVFDAKAAYLLADMLSDGSARAASFGLQSYLSFDFPVACKTGTSSDYRDNWCMAYTPEFTVGVWVGNPDGKPMQAITGVTGAGPVMHEVMEYLHRTRGTTWYRAPEGLVQETVDPLTGRQAPSGRKGAATTWCLHPVEPARAADYDAHGRVRLPAEYAAWVASPQNNLGSLIAGTEAAPELRIIQPTEGSTFFLDGDLPAEAQWVRLQAEGPGEVAWSCATLSLREEAGSTRAELRDGRYELVALEPGTGRRVSRWIEVKRW